MGKQDRISEINEIEKYFKSINLSILGKIKAPGTLEGDVIWIDNETIAVGEDIEQIKKE